MCLQLYKRILNYMRYGSVKRRMGEGNVSVCLPVPSGGGRYPPGLGYPPWPGLCVPPTPRRQVMLRAVRLVWFLVGGLSSFDNKTCSLMVQQTYEAMCGLLRSKIHESKYWNICLISQSRKQLFWIMWNTKISDTLPNITIDNVFCDITPLNPDVTVATLRSFLTFGHSTRLTASAVILLPTFL